MTITTVLTEQEQHRFRESVRYAEAIAKRLFEQYHSRDVQSIASTLFIQAMRLDTDDLKPLARLYLHAGQLAASCLPDAYPPAVLSAAATIFIQHVGHELERTSQTPQAPQDPTERSEPGPTHVRSNGKRAHRHREYVGVRELAEQELLPLAEGG